ncbi:MAG: DUF2283 domain-containing protein [Thermoprotei archaeon]|nr:MAG: DUF2283 domain-containing protein [Thermoprotei archaeon]
MTELRISYDPVADALYIRLRDDKVADSVEICRDIIIDYNAKGEVIGVEILNFSKKDREVNLNEVVLRGIEVLIARLQEVRE